MEGLGSGIANSWIETYTTVPTPCINDTVESGTVSNCVVWIIVGVVIGSLVFGKKGKQS